MSALRDYTHKSIDGLDKDGSIPDFIGQAILFAERHRARFVFKLLKSFLRCDEGGLTQVLCKLYCLSIKSSQKSREGLIKTLFGLPLLPLHTLFSKDLFWNREEMVVYNLETTDVQYFESRYSEIYESLREPKRLTPRHPETFLRKDLSKGTFSSGSFGHVARLSVYAWVAYVPLVLFCLCTRLNILRSYREAMSVYVAFDSYFKRYPCLHYLTYADDTNHPSRYFAFRHNCSGKMIVVQNGERSYQPSWSFGMVDYYFAFGETYIKMARELCYHMEEGFPVGSLTLSQHFSKLGECETVKEFDILYIDNGSLVPPDYGGLEEHVARSEEIIFGNLNEFALRHKECRIAFQLRYYDDSAQKEYVVQVIRRMFDRRIMILDNDGAGASYRNIMKARLTLTFQSTMGFESMILGAKTLFINYSGEESESLCSDTRFQIDDVDHDYTYFESRIEWLLSLEEYSVPEIAHERHYSFDGEVQRRIINTLRQRLG